MLVAPHFCISVLLALAVLFTQLPNLLARSIVRGGFGVDLLRWKFLGKAPFESACFGIALRGRVDCL